MSNESDDLIASITPEVMRVLESRRFFVRLDDLMSPTIEAQQPERCEGRYRLSERLLREDGFDDDDLQEILQVLHAQGGCCDCEVLYNVSEDNRLKATYWKRRAAEHQSAGLAK